LSILYNYFDSLTKLPAKILDLSAKSFFPCMMQITLLLAG